MAKLKNYEMRPRGEFMLLGKIVQAENQEMAMLDPKGGNKIDCLVLENDDENDWWLITADRGWFKPIVQMNRMVVQPYDPEPLSRLVIAKKCEAICQDNEKNPSVKFTDFDHQLKKYEETKGAMETEYIEIREGNKKEAIKWAAACIKECALAETATIAGKGKKAGEAMNYARSVLEDALGYSADSRAPWDTKPNEAEKAAANAKKQYNKTMKKNRKIRKRTMLCIHTTAKNDNNIESIH